LPWRLSLNADNGGKPLYCYHNGVPTTPHASFPAIIETVFLDRDGVINRKMPEGRYVTRWNEFQMLPGVPQAVALLNNAGIRVIVVSNQRGIALGLYAAEDVRALHAELQSLLHTHAAHIDAFYFCPHDRQQCDCRKPLPGMFEQAAADFPSITAATSVMIGDSLSDIEFGHRLGITTVLLDGEPALQKPDMAAARDLAGLRFASLPVAVIALLAGQTD
jgi:D-glycero-D-manno-heptose 1,7-bisphosphate phosphatase